MKAKHLWNLLTGKTKALKPAKLNLRNSLAVIQAFLRKKVRNRLPDHIHEQIIWRRTQVMEKSPECWNQNECIVCGCDVIGKTYEDRACEGNCYPEMMKAEKWKEFKNINNIKLFE